VTFTSQCNDVVLRDDDDYLKVRIMREARVSLHAPNILPAGA
jgi:hypothetical protein